VARAVKRVSYAWLTCLCFGFEFSTKERVVWKKNNYFKNIDSTNFHSPSSLQDRRYDVCSKGAGHYAPSAFGTGAKVGSLPRRIGTFSGSGKELYFAGGGIL
jgi:hypothetical protein